MSTIDVMCRMHGDLLTYREAVTAATDFAEQVGALALRMVERGDPDGLVLLELFKDLYARLGELSTEETT